MAVENPLSAITCRKCGHVTMINPTHTRVKRCRHCGSVIFKNGMVVSMLKSYEPHRGSDWT